MKKLYCLLLSCIFVWSLSANTTADKETKVDSEIFSVTVFRTGAQVKRKAKTKVPKGSSTIIFTGISPTIDITSIQVKGEGDFTILSVSNKENFFDAIEATAEKERLEATADSLRLMVEDEKLLLEVLAEEKSFILHNKSIKGEDTGVDSQELMTLAEFYQRRFTEIKRQELSIQRKIKMLNTDMLQSINQLNELSNKQQESTLEVVLALEAEQSTPAEFILSYYVARAGWNPNYDIRVQNVESPISLIYKGNVYQSSGEEWKDINLTLSTGNPNRTGTKPQLEPWRLGFYNSSYQKQSSISRQGGVYPGQFVSGPIRTVQGFVYGEDGDPLIGATVSVPNTEYGTITDIDGKYSVTVPEGVHSIEVSYVGYQSLTTRITSNVMELVLSDSSMSLSEVSIVGSRPTRSLSGLVNGVRVSGDRKVDRLKDNQQVEISKVNKFTTTEFVIEEKYDIPSDGKAYTVGMDTHQIEAAYEYYCAPKLDLSAFLTAKILDWEDYSLLNGEANLFFEGSYIGKSFLDVQNTEDTLAISLGRDDGIIVKRTKIKDRSKRQFVGLKKQEARAWEIKVHNTKSEAINLVVEDQYPVSTRSEIEVKTIDHDGANYNEETGLLTWNVKLDPGESTSYGLEYMVKLNKHKRIDLP